MGSALVILLVGFRCRIPLQESIEDAPRRSDCGGSP